VSSLQELYGDMILDHNRRPRNFGPLPDRSHSARGDNPLCGDRVTVNLRLADGRIEGISFEGVGCAISTASASMMTEALRGRTVEEAQQVFARFHRLLTGEPDEHADLGKLEAFAGVREYPMRVKCATLAWHALQAALASPVAAVTAAVAPAGGPQP
jgi:nitrogen fixation NifU-like protein